MRRTPALLLVALTLAAALAGCKKDAQVEAALAELHAFTQEVVRRVESAPDVSAGVEDAQRFFDSRRADIQAKLVDLNGVREFQISEETRKKMVEQTYDDMLSVAKLKIKYGIEAARDPALGAKLEKLVGDYQNLLQSAGS